MPIQLELPTTTTRPAVEPVPTVSAAPSTNGPLAALVEIVLMNGQFGIGEREAVAGG